MGFESPQEQGNESNALKKLHNAENLSEGQIERIEKLRTQLNKKLDDLQERVHREQIDSPDYVNGELNYLRGMIFEDDNAIGARERTRGEDRLPKAIESEVLDMLGTHLEERNAIEEEQA